MLDLLEGRDRFYGQHIMFPIYLDLWPNRWIRTCVQ